jgi:hypothetical protein
MALNWTMLGQDRSPIPLPNETTITTVDAGVEISLSIPDVPPSGTVSAGGLGGSKKSKGIGRVWLTDQRVRWYSKSINATDYQPLLHHLLSRAYLCCTIIANIHHRD